MHNLDDLIYLMQRLRDPETGCPWDLDQVFTSITDSTLEEAYELVDAIEQGDMQQVKEELGDVLFQVVFYAQMADELGQFDFHQIIDRLSSKLIRRHPHVFPSGQLREQVRSTLDEAAVKAQWEAIKQEERQQKALSGMFDDIPSALPAMTRAKKIIGRLPPDIQQDAASEAVIRQAMQQLPADSSAVQDEEYQLGQLLFAVVSFAKQQHIDPEKALRRVNRSVVKTFDQENKLR